MESEGFTPVLSEEIRELSLNGQVGLKNIPNQLLKRHLTDGFTFNILCIGETGIGKSSLISSLFNTEVENYAPPTHKHSSVNLRSRTHFLKEKGVNLELTVTETTGFGDQINIEKSHEPVVQFIDLQLEKYLQEELRVNRSLATFKDSRIHACLYFICPTGHHLKAIDLLCLKSINHKVNVIPIVAKADTLTKLELEKFKDNIEKELRRENISTYDFPVDDDIVLEACSKVPFGVVGSVDYIEIEGKTVRGRRYPWGTVSIEDEDHSDFSAFREKLIRTNMVDLKEQTHEKHYESFRKQCLEQLGYRDFEEEGIEDTVEMVQKKAEKARNTYLSGKDELVERFLVKAKQNQQELMEQEERTHNKFKELFLQAELEERALREESEFFEKEVFEFRKKKRTIS